MKKTALNRYLSKMLVGAILVNASFLFVGANISNAYSFSDISTSFARDDIESFAKAGIIGGYSDGTFRPNNPISRAEFLAVVMKTFGIAIDSSLQSTDFKDVTVPWMIPYVEKAKGFGINGTLIDTKRYFMPDNRITRAEALKMLFLIGSIDPSTSSTSTYSDISAGWMIVYIEKARELSIASGQMIDGTLKFRPNDPISRAESVKIISKAKNLGNTAPVTAQSKTVQIGISSFSFSPAGVEINAGDIVRWTNYDSAAHSLSITDLGDTVLSPTLNTGDTFEHKFSTRLTVDYFCRLHPSMTGKIIVK